MTFCQKGGKFLIAVNRELEQHHPLLGALKPVFPPVGRDDRTVDLSAGGEARLYRGARDLHRFRA
jgi:hypothetical protein